MVTMLMVDSAAEARDLKRSALVGDFLVGGEVMAGVVGSAVMGVGDIAKEGCAGVCIDP